MDKNGNRTEIKRERNGNCTVLPFPLYGWKMGTFFDAYPKTYQHDPQSLLINLVTIIRHEMTIM